MNNLTPEMINEIKDNKIKDIVGKNEKSGIKVWS